MLCTSQWTEDTETALFNRAIIASRVPPVRAVEPRPVTTPEEIRHITDHWVWVAGHDTHIVRSLVLAAPLFGCTEECLMIARQMGDDGAHAEFLRDYVRDRTGDDPILQIEQIAEQHDDMLGDLPYRDIHSFFAWQLHYEFYILARLHIERRTARLYDPGLRAFAVERIGPDEEEHRLRIMNWFLAYYAGLDPAERTEVAGRVIAYDNDIQRRLRSYLIFRYRQSAISMDQVVADAAAIYDRFRHAILATIFGDHGDCLVALGSLQ